MGSDADCANSKPPVRERESSRTVVFMRDLQGIIVHGARGISSTRFHSCGQSGRFSTSRGRRTGGRAVVLTFPKPNGATTANLIANAATGLWGSYMIKKMVEL